MTPGEWNKLLHEDVSWKKSYPIVAEEVRKFLDGRPLSQHDAPLSTNELVQALYPKELERGEGITARKRLYRALAALATNELGAYCHRGEPVKSKFKMAARPWRWHGRRSLNDEAIGQQIAKGRLHVCPKCGEHFAD